MINSYNVIVWSIYALTAEQRAVCHLKLCDGLLVIVLFCLVSNCNVTAKRKKNQRRGLFLFLQIIQNRLRWEYEISSSSVSCLKIVNKIVFQHKAICLLSTKYCPEFVVCVVCSLFLLFFFVLQYFFNTTNEQSNIQSKTKKQKTQVLDCISWNAAGSCQVVSCVLLFTVVRKEQTFHT